MKPLRRAVILFIVFVALVTAVSIPFISAVQQNNTDTYLPLILNPAHPPVIHSFTADRLVANPGDTVELSWETQYATTVTLYHLMPTGQFGTFWDVAPSGTMTYTISEGSRNVERFALFADNDAFTYTSASLEITLTCPYAWFFSPAPAICPQNEAIPSPGAEQHFERGVMIWSGEEDLIYVLFDDDIFSPKWTAFADLWEEGDPVDDPGITPPSGLYQPQRGFGLVWREQPGVRDRLGWATAPEAGYEIIVQRTSYAKYNEIYMRALDGNVWWLKAEHSAWEKIVPD